MAWLERRGKKYRLSFRYDGQLFRHSLGTDDQREAEACRAWLEDSLNRLERGWLVPPPGADLVVFLLSGGEAVARPSGWPSRGRSSNRVRLAEPVRSLAGVHHRPGRWPPANGTPASVREEAWYETRSDGRSATGGPKPGPPEDIIV